MESPIDYGAEYDKIYAVCSRWLEADGKLNIEGWRLKLRWAEKDIREILLSGNTSTQDLQDTALTVGTRLRKGTPTYVAENHENDRIREELARAKEELEAVKKANIELEVDNLIQEEGWKASRQSVLNTRKRYQAEIGALRKGWAMNFNDLQSSLDTHVKLESGHTAIINRQYRLLGITPFSRNLGPTIPGNAQPTVHERQSAAIPQQTRSVDCDIAYPNP